MAPRLTPDDPPRMLGEAIRHLRTLPLDPAQRAAEFEAMAKQIEMHSGGSWNAARGTGADGSIIFLGRQGEAMIIDLAGRIYRGALGTGVRITPAGLRPDFGVLIPLD